jgi:glycosyltransferase involved in cell wall biosynthesis
LLTQTKSPAKVLAFMEATVVNGAAKTLLNFCNTIRQSSGSLPVEVTIATFYRGEITPGKPANAFLQAVESLGIRAIVIPERYRFDPRALKTLRERVRSESPDILQTNNVKSHAMVKMAGLHREFPWLAFHHGYTMPDFKMKLYNQLDRWSLPSASQVIAVCGPFRDQLTAMGVPASRIRILHNSAATAESVPDALVGEIRRRFGLPRDGTRLLVTIGRLSFEKGHADLLHALRRLRDTRPDLQWKLVIVGSGPEENNLRDLARKLGLQSHTVFTSHQNNVLPFYGLADAMMLPSHTEGSPHVVLEAMAAGVPIVATSVGGVPEILTDGETALLVPAHNADAMSSAIAKLLDSPELARSIVAHARAVLVRNFSHEAYRDAMLAIYDDLLGPANPVPIRRPA